MSKDVSIMYNFDVFAHDSKVTIFQSLIFQVDNEYFYQIEASRV